MQRLINRMKFYPIAVVRQAYVAVCRAESGKKSSGKASMESMGYEVVDSDGPITDDGREVVSLYGAHWAMRREVHAERLAAALEAAKKAMPEPETKSVIGTESLSAIVCPKCGDALQHTTVCPSCAAGKLGYRHRYTCACGGADLISKDKL